MSAPPASTATDHGSMRLIHFSDPIGGLIYGATKGGHTVAILVEAGNGWKIQTCLGLAEMPPPFRHKYQAQHACEAYMAKFLLDIGFAPTCRAGVVE